MHTIIAKRVTMNRQRITKGLSIRGLATLAKLNPVTILKIENQRSKPNPSTAAKICKALDLGFDELFELIKKD